MGVIRSSNGNWKLKDTGSYSDVECYLLYVNDYQTDDSYDVLPVSVTLPQLRELAALINGLDVPDLEE